VPQTQVTSLGYVWGLGALRSLPVKLGPNTRRFNLQNRAKLQKHTQTQSYNFVVAGDNRDGDAILLEMFKRAQPFQPRFMLHSGDFVPEGRKHEYLNFLKLLKTCLFSGFARNWQP
jgi:hypothetical protein